MITSELNPLARAISELLVVDFNAVADTMACLDSRDEFYYAEALPYDRVDFISSIIKDMAAEWFDVECQDDWAEVDADQLFPYVRGYLSDALWSFAEQYAVALNYLAYRDVAEPEEPFGHDVYGAVCYLNDLLLDAGDITAAAFCDAWYYGDNTRMLTLLDFDPDLFAKARGLRYCSLDDYTFADIENELS